MVYISKKRRKYLIEQKFKKIFFRVFLPIFIFFLFSIFFMNANFMKIKNIEVLGNKYVVKENINNIIDQIISEKYFGIYNKNNFLYYPENKIVRSLYSEEKRIKEIDISYSNYMQNIKVNITEKKPEYLFCFNKVDCFFVEKNGEIFTKFNKEKTEKKESGFIVFEDLFFGFEELDKEEEVESIVNYETYKRVYRYSDFTNITKLIKLLEKDNLLIKRVVRDENSNFILFTKSNKKILVKYNQDFEKVPSTLKTLSQKKVFKVDKFKKDFISDLVYIDLTYQDYIFYCQKKSECQKNYNY